MNYSARIFAHLAAVLAIGLVIVWFLLTAGGVSEESGIQFGQAPQSTSSLQGEFDSSTRIRQPASGGKQPFEAVGGAGSERTKGAENDKAITSSQVIYETQPHVAYEHFEAAARSGDEKAQLFLSLIIDRCSNYLNDEDLAARKARGNVDEVTLQELTEISRNCKGLDQLLGEDTFQSWSQQWLATAAINGSPIAELKINQESEVTTRYTTDSLPQPEHVSKIKLIIASFEYAGSDEVLLSEAITQAAVYYSDLLEKPPNDDAIMRTNRRSVGRDAWRLLSCRHQFGCDYDSLYAMLRESHYEYEFQEIVERSAYLEAVIAATEWGRLGLHEN